jgi:hypothetical protein
VLSLTRLDLVGRGSGTDPYGSGRCTTIPMGSKREIPLKATEVRNSYETGTVTVCPVAKLASIKTEPRKENSIFEAIANKTVDK